MADASAGSTSPGLDAAAAVAAAALHPLIVCAKIYAEALSAAPVFTNCATAGVLTFLADAIAQGFGPNNGKRVYDWPRAGWSFVWGICFGGLFLGWWLSFLAMLFPLAATSTPQLIAKVCVNQLLLAPGSSGGFFAFAIWVREPPVLLMDRAKRAMLAAKLRADLVPTMVRSCAYWFVVWSFTFIVVPIELQLAFSNLAFLAWMVYVSLVGQPPPPPERTGEDEAKSALV
jgi:hypothetical protein